MKKITKIFLVIIIFSFFITGCTSKKEEKLTDAEKFKKEYESLNNKSDGELNYLKVKITKDNPIVYTTPKNYTTPKKVIAKINNNDLFVLYLGSAKDNESRKIINLLLSSAKDNNVKYLYYIDTKKYDSSLDELKDTLNKGDNKIDDIRKTPSILVISKKEIYEKTTDLSKNGEKSIKIKRRKYNLWEKCLLKNKTENQSFFIPIYSVIIKSIGKDDINE